MTIVLWPVLECNVWLAEAEWLLAQWPQLTGRVCPACGEKALVGHGRRRRSVHEGTARGAAGAVCAVVWFWVQRVRCKACGRTHTLLPAFVARYQRHPSAVRERATGLREAGRSWGEIMRALVLPMLSATSPRRWVAGVLARYGAAVVELRQSLAAGPVGAMPYAPVVAAGGWDGFVEAAGCVLRREAPGAWPDRERVAGTNWWAGRHRRPVMV